MNILNVIKKHNTSFTTKGAKVLVQHLNERLSYDDSSVEDLSKQDIIDIAKNYQQCAMTEQQVKEYEEDANTSPIHIHADKFVVRVY